MVDVRKGKEWEVFKSWRTDVEKRTHRRGTETKILHYARVVTRHATHNCPKLCSRWDRCTQFCVSTHCYGGLFNVPYTDNYIGNNTKASSEILKIVLRVQSFMKEEQVEMPNTAEEISLRKFTCTSLFS